MLLEPKKHFSTTVAQISQNALYIIQSNKHAYINILIFMQESNALYTTIQ